MAKEDEDWVPTIGFRDMEVIVYLRREVSIEWQGQKTDWNDSREMGRERLEAVNRDSSLQEAPFTLYCNQVWFTCLLLPGGCALGKDWSCSVPYLRCLPQQLAHGRCSEWMVCSINAWNTQYRSGLQLWKHFDIMLRTNYKNGGSKPIQYDTDSF